MATRKRTERPAPRGDKSERPLPRSERSVPRSERGAAGRAARAEAPAAAPTPRSERAADRTEAQRYVYGMNPVLEALRARPEQIDKIYLTETPNNSSAAAEIFSRSRDAGIRVEKVIRERLAILSEGGVHQGVVAEIRGFDYAELEDLLAAAEKSGRPPLLVVLDGIQDPHNLGAIIRSAHALGAHGVVIAKDRASPVTGTVAKASAGAVEHCPIARVVNLSRALETLKEAGVWTVAADPESKETLWKAKLDGPLAIVVGAEGAGVREGVLKHCDFKLNIPMLGEVSSLNASVSAAVLLYEAVRQRG